MITIMTVNHDTPKFIELCIRAVHLRTNIPYRHLIIDNGSRPATKTLLREFKGMGWIDLLERKAAKGSWGHAEALDQVLKKEFGLVCLLDSDAYPADPTWLRFLHDGLIRNKASAIGFPHFRDATLLHPACMLFRHSDFVAAGRPSFRIKGSLRTKFWDTGMIVCREMRRKGKLVPCDEKELGRMVKHRWRATRAEVATHRRQNVLDETPLIKYARKSRDWFKDPSAMEALDHH